MSSKKYSFLCNSKLERVNIVLIKKKRVLSLTKYSKYHICGLRFFNVFSGDETKTISVLLFIIS